MTTKEEKTPSCCLFHSASLRHLLQNVLKETSSSQPFHQAFHAAGVTSAEDLLYFTSEDWRSFRWTTSVKAEKDNREEIEKVTHRLSFTQTLKLNAVRAWYAKYWKADCGRDPDEFLGTLTHSDFVAFRAEASNNNNSIEAMNLFPDTSTTPTNSSSSQTNGGRIGTQVSKQTKRARNVLELSSSSDDEEESESVLARKYPRRKVEKSKGKECIIVNDDSDDDNEIECLGTYSSLVSSSGASTSFWDSPTSYQMSRGIPRNIGSQDYGTSEKRELVAMNIFPRSKSNTRFTAPTEGIVETIDAEDAPADDLLKKLLLHIGCRYSLLPHQYEGVRKTAGLESDFPKGLVGLIKQRSHQTTWNEVLSKSNLSKRRGILLADVMGLGKTVQGAVACMLRNAISSVDAKPTIIVGPNESVLHQWRESLVKAGVLPGCIRNFVRTEPDAVYQGNIFVLLTRYQLQSETRGLLARSKGKNDSSPVPKSPLFPRLNNAFLEQLRNIYACSNGKEECKYKRRDETLLQCTTRLLTHAVPDVSHSFRTVIIDEAHFHKNLLAYWGMGAAMLGLCAHWVVPLTGTPYNNRSQDMATLMTFINPSHPAANDKWWREATRAGNAGSIARAVHKWSTFYIVRREKNVLTVKLPNKSVCSERFPSLKSK